MAADLPPGLTYEEDDGSALAAAFRTRPDFNAVVRRESALSVHLQHERLPRLRWFKRWRLRGVLKVLARDEEAYRAGGSADR